MEHVMMVRENHQNYWGEGENPAREKDGGLHVLPHPWAHAIQSPVICAIN